MIKGVLLMWPYITVLGREISMYAIMGLLGVAAGAGLASTRAQRPYISVPRSDVIYIAAYGALGGLLGAKLLFLLTQIGNIGEDLKQYSIPQILQKYFASGFVFYGGLFGLAGGVYLYCRYMKISFSSAMKLVVPVLPLVHAFGRVGCFMAGCCYGIAMDPPLGIAFEHSLSAPNHVHLLPVQLIEAVALTGIFVALWMYTATDRPIARILCLYLALYAPVRFILEFFRGDVNRGFLRSLSTSQWISLLLLITAAVYFIYGRIKTYVEKA